MTTCFRMFLVSLGLIGFAACSDDDTEVSGPSSGAQGARDAAVAEEDADTEDAGGGAASSRVLDLDDVKSKPDDYEWFDFRPNVKKLILAGAAETEHIAILWYTTADGGVGLHYHSKTESVYVIDGSQTDGKGEYPTGSLYFNPPGSGHQITDSSGFFLLAYAAPPDFMATDKIEEYTPVRIDTAADDLTSSEPFEEQKAGVRVFTPALEGMGGMSAELIEISAEASYAYTGNYLLVLDGSCEVDGATRAPAMLVVGETVEPGAHEIAAAGDGRCLALGVSFTR